MDKLYNQQANQPTNRSLPPCLHLTMRERQLRNNYAFKSSRWSLNFVNLWHENETRYSEPKIAKVQSVTTTACEKYTNSGVHFTHVEFGELFMTSTVLTLVTLKALSTSSGFETSIFSSDVKICCSPPFSRVDTLWKARVPFVDAVVLSKALSFAPPQRFLPKWETVRRWTVHIVPENRNKE